MTDFIQNVNLSWDSTDTSPVLAGDLDVNGNNIVSINNGDINLVPDGSGRIILDTVRVEGNTLSTVNGQALNFNDNVTFAGDVTVTGAFEAATSGTPTLESVGDINIEPAGKLVVDAPIVLKSYTVAQLQVLGSTAGAIAYATDESGGAQPCFFDGTNWRRFTDRVVIS
jgi:hypothetical protein